MLVCVLWYNIWVRLLLNYSLQFFYDLVFNFKLLNFTSSLDLLIRNFIFQLIFLIKVEVHNPIKDVF